MLIAGLAFKMSVAALSILLLLLEIILLLLLIALVVSCTYESPLVSAGENRPATIPKRLRQLSTLHATVMHGLPDALCDLITSYVIEPNLVFMQSPRIRFPRRRTIERARGRIVIKILENTGEIISKVLDGQKIRVEMLQWQLVGLKNDLLQCRCAWSRSSKTHQSTLWAIGTIETKDDTTKMTRLCLDAYGFENLANSAVRGSNKILNALPISDDDAPFIHHPKSRHCWSFLPIDFNIEVFEIFANRWALLVFRHGNKQRLFAADLRKIPVINAPIETQVEISDFYAKPNIWQEIMVEPHQLDGGVGKLQCMAYQSCLLFYGATNDINTSRTYLFDKNKFKALLKNGAWPSPVRYFDLPFYQNLQFETYNSCNQLCKYAGVDLDPAARCRWYFGDKDIIFVRFGQDGNPCADQTKSDVLLKIEPDFYMRPHFV